MIEGQLILNFLGNSGIERIHTKIKKEPNMNDMLEVSEKIYLSHLTF
jgi:hypothetical protein